MGFFLCSICGQRSSPEYDEALGATIEGILQHSQVVCSHCFMMLHPPQEIEGRARLDAHPAPHLDLSFDIPFDRILSLGQPENRVSFKLPLAGTRMLCHVEVRLEAAQDADITVLEKPQMP